MYRIILIAFICFGCKGGGLNDKPPSYIKEVGVWQEGDGVCVYFILADKSRAMTTSDGEAIVTITEYIISTERLLYQKTFQIKKSDFKRRKLRNIFGEYDVILCDIGRIPYSEFSIPPIKYYNISGVRFSTSLKVSVQFKTKEGRILGPKSDRILSPWD